MPCIRYASEQETMDSGMKTLYESHFGINFATKDMETFVNKLHGQFSANQLRQPVANKEKPKKYIKAAFIKFLNSAFNATDLDSLCMCYFEPVYEQFTNEQSKLTRINLLIDHVGKNNLYDDLMEYGKEQNQIQFEKFAPYYE